MQHREAFYATLTVRRAWLVVVQGVFSVYCNRIVTNWVCTLQVQKAKNWKDIATHLGISAPNPNTAYTLKKQYIKFILPYEARFDRGGVDPESLVQAAEALSARAPGRGGTPGAPRKRNRGESRGFLMF